MAFEPEYDLYGEHQPIPSGNDRTIISEGTLVYIAVPCTSCAGICTCPDIGINLLDHKKNDPYTGKFGVAFGTYMAYTVGALLPYIGKIKVYTYMLSTDLLVDNSIYEFRGINPQRFFDSDGNLIPDVSNLLPEENTSHYEMANPVSRFGDALECPPIDATDGELFLTKDDELNSLVYVKFQVFDCGSGESA
jgi:hypothetical protein